MWGAIKSDLLDFISTIQTDTSKTLATVLGENEGEEEKSIKEKLILDTKRSFGTYGTEIEEKNRNDYIKFLKKFSLSDYSQEISAILDTEVDVPRYYADLVPSQLRPEEFWSRYFYRLNLITQPVNGIQLPDDEEEELVWEEEVNKTAQSNSQVDPKTLVLKSVSVPTNKGDTSDKEYINQLQDENTRLRNGVRALVSRVEELEHTVNENATIIARLTRENEILKLNTPASTTSTQPSDNKRPPVPATHDSSGSATEQEQELDYFSESGSSHGVVVITSTRTLDEVTAARTKSDGNPAASFSGGSQKELLLGKSKLGDRETTDLDEDEEQESWD